MDQENGRMLRPLPGYYRVEGRAAEIARSLGSPVGAEHVFLAILHAGGEAADVLAGLVDLVWAEAAVLEILHGPDYAPPPAPRFPLRPDYMYPYGMDIAFARGDSGLEPEHALLAMIRQRESVPARALAGLADLAGLEAAVLAALDGPPPGPSASAVFLPEGQRMDGPLRGAIARALPPDTTFGFNSDADGRAWMHVFGPGDTDDPVRSAAVLNAALASLGRPTLDG